MKRLLSRHLRRSPRATLQIETNEGTPPGNAPGGVIVTVTVCPEEPFALRRGLLELLLSTTHFSRTTLDGYREHTAEEVWLTVELFENTQASPGDVLVRTTTLQLPQAPESRSRPARMRWQARVIIEPEGDRGSGPPRNSARCPRREAARRSSTAPAFCPSTSSASLGSEQPSPPVSLDHNSLAFAAHRPMNIHRLG